MSARDKWFKWLVLCGVGFILVGGFLRASFHMTNNPVNVSSARIMVPGRDVLHFDLITTKPEYNAHTAMETRNSVNVSSVRIMLPGRDVPHFDLITTKPEYNAHTAMEKRVEAVREVCATEKQMYGEMRLNVSLTSYLVSKDRRSLLYCPIPKAGWSTWKALLFREAGAERWMDVKTGWNSYWEKAGLITVSSSHKINTTHRMVFVRNPYERLLSAYKDKVLRGGGHFIRHIHSYGPFSRHPLPALTFPQFISCIIRQAQKFASDTSKFGSGRNLDIHWKPQTLLCDFCSVDFNVIGDLQYMDEDLGEAMEKLSMKNRAVLWVNSMGANKPGELTLAQWYSQVSEMNLEQVKKLYSHDFRMLGFSTEVPK